jgi:hypothetical protein
MPRPSYGYALADGIPIPGVTTLIGRFDDKSFLIDWANKMGLQGISTKDIRNEAFRDGKEIHHVFENVIKRRAIDVKPEHEKFVETLTNFLRDLEVVDVLSEIALVSEVHKFGGTPDLIIKTLSGEDMVLDFKFANYIGVGVAYQMGAYKILIEENMRRTIKRGIGVHLEKKKFKKGETAIKFIEVVDLEFYAQAFLGLRAMYDKIKEAEERFKQI